MTAEPSSDYFFDKDEAHKIVRFFEGMLTHPKGGSGKPKKFILEPWQKEFVTNLVAWKSKKTGLRKYRSAYCEIPRKNGKTTLATGILLYMLLVDKENGKEIYSAATTRDQAGLVFEIASGMIRNAPALASRCEIIPSRKRIVTADGYFQACSAEAGALHGTNPHTVIFDELHLQKNRDMWEAFHTGFGARSQPLFLAITTAGHDRSSVCWEQHEYAKGIIDGTINDETFYPKLFSASQDDDWTDEKVWEKANPCLDVSLSRDYLRAECKQAQEIPGLENSFRRLHLNQWTEQEKRIIPMMAWDKCRRQFSEADMYGRPCFGGLDLSSTRDATAFVLVFPESDGGFKVLPWFWIPQENVDRQAGADKRQLLNYAQQGHIELTDGNEIDVFHLASRVVEICQRYEVQYIGYDPWNSTGVIQAMVNNGLPENALVKMPQSFATYNEPFKRLLATVENQKMEHNGNNVLRWMAGNVAAKEDPSGNIRPDKGKSADKIDGICAMLMALALSISYGSNERAYSTEGSGVVLF